MYNYACKHTYAHEKYLIKLTVFHLIFNAAFSEASNEIHESTSAKERRVFSVCIASCLTFLP